MHHKRIVRLLVIIDFDTILDEIDHDYVILLVIKDDIYALNKGYTCIYDIYNKLLTTQVKNTK